jgi:hypothetical protein
MKNVKITVGLVLFTGLAIGSYHLIEAQRASAQTQQRQHHARDSTLWFVTTRNG